MDGTGQSQKLLGDERMTPEEAEVEWNYRVDERLGILCGSGPVTQTALMIATVEATKAVDELRR